MNSEVPTNSLSELGRERAGWTVDAVLLAALFLAFLAQVLMLSRVDIDIAGVFVRALFFIYDPVLHSHFDNLVSRSA